MGLGSLFKKKKDDMDLGLDLGSDPSMNSNQNNPLGDFHTNDHNFDSGMNNNAVNLSTMGMQNFNQQMPMGPSTNSGGDLQKDLQIISLKLDSIKSDIDSMNQRLRNLESIAEREQQSKQQPKRWY